MKGKERERGQEMGEQGRRRKQKGWQEAEEEGKG